MAEAPAFADLLLQAGSIMNGIDLSQIGLQGSNACGIDGFGVGAGSVEITRQLRGRAGGPVRSACELIKDGAQLILIALPCLPAAAPAIHRGRDRILSAPGAIGEVEEIVAGFDRLVEIACFDSGQSGFLAMGAECGRNCQREYQN